MSPRPHQPAGTRKAELSAETRTTLLEAGAVLLREQPAGTVLGQITGRAVAKRAGRTTGAFFHHWATQEAFQRDLVEYVLDPARITSTDKAVKAVRAGLAGGRNPETLLRAAAQANFASVRRDPYVPLWFGLWSTHARDGQVSELLRRHYRSVTERMLPVYEELVRGSGRRMRPPYTAEDLTVSVTALVQGLALRAAIEPEAVPTTTAVAAPTEVEPTPGRDLFGDLVVELFRATTVESDPADSTAASAGPLPPTEA